MYNCGVLVDDEAVTYSIVRVLCYVGFGLKGFKIFFHAKRRRPLVARPCEG